MLELKIAQNNNSYSQAYGKWYPRVSYKQTMSLHDMAKHMAEHNTPFSEGTIEGILRDLVKCIREQTLLGNTVKIDDLAIFKCTIEGNGIDELYHKASGEGTDLTDITIAARLGTPTYIGTGSNKKAYGASVGAVKLLAQATGEYKRAELESDASFGWTDETAKKIAQAKEAANTDDGDNG